jgi:two-component system sensor histidine kinase FlrB
MPHAAQQSSVPDLAGAAASLSTMPANAAQLEQAFSLFNQMSTQLTDSYSLLEARVAELKGELALAGERRVAELAENQRLANRLQHLLDLLPGGVIVIDDRGLVSEANPAAAR